jgi:hypothetical protein
MTTRLRLTTAATALAVAGLGTVLAPGQAQAAPDTSCQKAGIKTLKSAGLLSTVARNGVSLEAAGGLGVEPRDPALDPAPSPTRSRSRCCWPTTAPVTTACSSTPGADLTCAGAAAPCRPGALIPCGRVTNSDRPRPHGRAGARPTRA